MKKYYLISYKKEKWLLTKKEIFNIIDSFVKIKTPYEKILTNSIIYCYALNEKSYIKTDCFVLNPKYQYSIKKSKFNRININNEKEYIYASHFFAIKNEIGQNINIQDFINSYKESRGLLKKKRKNIFYYIEGSKRRSTYLAYYRCKYGKGFKKEYENILYSEENEIKVRTKRKKWVEFKLKDSFGDPLYRNQKTSWKGKKIKKQYMKNKI